MAYRGPTHDEAHVPPPDKDNVGRIIAQGSFTPFDTPKGGMLKTANKCAQRAGLGSAYGYSISTVGGVLEYNIHTPGLPIDVDLTLAGGAGDFTVNRRHAATYKLPFRVWPPQLLAHLPSREPASAAAPTASFADDIEDAGAGGGGMAAPDGPTEADAPGEPLATPQRPPGAVGRAPTASVGSPLQSGAPPTPWDMAADAKVQQAAAATDTLVRRVVSLVQTCHARFPHLAAALHGNSVIEASSMGHLYQLPLNVLGDWRDSLVRQLQAYELVVASVNKYYKDNGALGRAAREVFADYAAFDMFAADNMSSQGLDVQLSWAEKVVFSVPVGQLALMMVLHFAPAGGSKVAARVLSCAQQVSFVDPSGAVLRITNLSALREAVTSAEDANARADWHQAMQVLTGRIAATRSLTFYSLTSAGVPLDWKPFAVGCYKLNRQLAAACADDAVTMGPQDVRRLISQLAQFVVALAADADDEEDVAVGDGAGVYGVRHGLGPSVFENRAALEDHVGRIVRDTLRETLHGSGAEVRKVGAQAWEDRRADVGRAGLTAAQPM